MANEDYFFLIFLGTITVTRLLLLNKGIASPTISDFRTRHYMYGIVLIVLSFFISNLTMFAIGLALLADELPLVIVKGPGHREESWRGCEDYYEPWVVLGVLVLLLLTYFFRDFIVQLI